MKSGASAPRKGQKKWALAPEPHVLLWPDTFNNYFLPSTAKAAVEVLESAGYHVIAPASESLLRPSALRLRHARPRAILAIWKSSTRCRPRSKPGFPVVGLEPSCVAVFRDELLNLFPHDARAQALRQPNISCSANFSKITPITPHSRAFIAKRCCTATATTNPS